MQKSIVPVIMAIVCVFGGYLAGSAASGIKAARNADITALLWIGAIDQLLQTGQQEKASKLCLIAAGGTLRAIERLQEHPIQTSMLFLPGNHADDALKQQTLERLRTQFAQRTEQVMPSVRQVAGVESDHPFPSANSVVPMAIPATNAPSRQ
jgi:hypothetical protein